MPEEKNFNDIFSKKLKYFLNIYEMNQAELAKRLGVGTTTVSEWCNGKKTPRMSKVDAMCELFHCKRSDFLTDDTFLSTNTVPIDSTRQKGVRIPVLGRVAAGIPINAVEEILDWEEIPEDMARQGEFFGLSIRGDSMSPRIMNGDVVIVRRQDDADTGDIVIAIVNGDDGCCKKLKKHPDGITLISLNPAYSPMVFTKTEIDDVPVRIIGKVVELRGKF